MSDHAAAPSTKDLYYGVLAEFKDIPSVFTAAQTCRDQGFKKWDVYAPVPIHGIDEAMGLKPSKVSYTMGMMAIAGVSLAVLLQGWTSAGWTITPDWLSQFSGYRINTNGKPYFAWEQFLPIIFELGVLLSAFGAIGGMLLLNGLPRWYHPLAKKPNFLGVSDDKLMICIESSDPNFDPHETRAFLESLGGHNVELVEH